MENINFFTSRLDVSKHFGQSSNGSEYSYEYHGALVPTGMVVSLYTKNAISVGVESFDLSTNCITTTGYPIPVSDMRVEIGSPVRRIFTLYSRNDNRNVTLNLSQFNVTYGTGGKLQGWVGKNIVSLVQNNNNFYLQGNGIQLSDIDNIVDIDYDLWLGEDNLVYQDTSAFQQRYPIVKHEGHYKPTNGASITAGNRYTFLTSIGHLYSESVTGADVYAGHKGYCTNKDLTKTTTTPQLNIQPTGDSPQSVQLNTNASTRDNSGFEDTPYGLTGSLDRRRLPPFGAANGQISLLSFLHPDTSFTSHFQTTTSTIQEFLPIKSTISRDNPGILFRSDRENYTINYDDCGGVDQFTLMVGSKMYRIPLGWTVRGYFRKSPKPTTSHLKNHIIVGDQPEANTAGYSVTVARQMGTAPIIDLEQGKVPTIKLEFGRITPEEYIINRNNTYTESATTGETGTIICEYKLNIDMDAYPVSARIHTYMHEYNQGGTVDRAPIDVNIKGSLWFYKIPGFSDIDGASASATDATGSRKNNNSCYGPSNPVYSQKNGFINFYAQSNNGTNKAVVELINHISCGPGIAPPLEGTLLDNPNYQNTKLYISSTDTHTFDHIVDRGSTQNSDGSGNVAGFSAHVVVDNNNQILDDDGRSLFCALVAYPEN